MTPETLRTLAQTWQARADEIRTGTDEREEADGLVECADALLVLIGDREDSTSRSRQHYIETGEHLGSCVECGEERAEDHGMCASCLHNAYRSGWEPGQ